MSKASEKGKKSREFYRHIEKRSKRAKALEKVEKENSSQKVNSKVTRWRW